MGDLEALTKEVNKWWRDFYLRTTHPQAMYTVGLFVKKRVVKRRGTKKRTVFGRYCLLKLSFWSPTTFKITKAILQTPRTFNTLKIAEKLCETEENYIFPMTDKSKVQYLQIMPQSQILHLEPDFLGIILVYRPFQKARMKNTSQKTQDNCRKSILLLAF